MSEQKKQTTKRQAAAKKTVATHSPVATAQAQSDEVIDNAVLESAEGGIETPTVEGAETKTESPEGGIETPAIEGANNTPTTTNETTPKTLGNGEANKQEQIIASSAVSQTQGNDNAREDNSSTGMGGDSTATDNGTTSNDGAKSSAASGSELDIASTLDINSSTLGEQVQGALLVAAKLDAGFWRSGIKFTRLEKTLVLVLAEEESNINGMDLQIEGVIEGIEVANVVCVNAAKAKKIHSEKNLAVTAVDLDELTIKGNK